MSVRSGDRRLCAAVLAALLLAGLWAGPLGATTLLEQAPLDRLVDESAEAILGEVIHVRHGLDPRGLPSTWVTLQIHDKLYGERTEQVGEAFTFKLFGAPIRLENGQRLFVDGTPRYRVGETYLLLLIEESDWGFTNTAGLYQGALPVRPGVNGSPTSGSLTPRDSARIRANPGDPVRIDALPRSQQAALQATAGSLDYTNLKEIVKGLRASVSSSGEWIGHAVEATH